MTIDRLHYRLAMLAQRCNLNTGRVYAVMVEQVHPGHASRAANDA